MQPTVERCAVSLMRPPAHAGRRVVQGLHRAVLKGRGGGKGLQPPAPLMLGGKPPRTQLGQGLEQCRAREAGPGRPPPHTHTAAGAA
jgi:hypothetical protein